MIMHFKSAARLRADSKVYPRCAPRESVVAGFRTPARRAYPRGVTSGVRKAPRHEIAGGIRTGRSLTLSYGDLAVCGPQLRLAAGLGEWWRWRCSLGARRFSGLLACVSRKIDVAVAW